MNSQRKYFSSCQKCILSQNVSNFGENFQQNRQKGILHVQRNTFTKTICWLCETISDFGQGNVGFAAENLQPCYQICTCVSGWAIGRIVLKDFLFFWFFRTSREYFLVFSLCHSRDGGPNWIPLARRNISARKNFVRKFSVLSGLWAHFFEHSLKSFRHVVKTTVYLFKRALWERSFFFEFFKNVFGLWAIIVQTYGEKFQQLFQMCILRVERSSRFFLQNFVVFHLTSCSSEKNLSSEKKFRQFCQSCILNVRELFEEFHSQKRFFFQI